MQIKIVNTSKNHIPAYQTEYSAGVDIRASLTDTITLLPMERKLINTGIYIEVPIGYYASIRPRSGLALQKGITIVNTPGTIDADYRGEITVLLINLSPSPVEIKNGDRIAQMIVSKYEPIEWIPTQSLTPSKRGDKGYGSTGVS
ncbi:MAG: dUTP diphosphatase [Chitinophagaceae bacterium]|nr:dUTP diphosphatase [Chitinophagaceae bacterium]